MSAIVATPSSAKSNYQVTAPVPHQYGTRIRSNSVIRPSARLRQSPDPPPPRRIKPAPVAKAKPSAIASEPLLIDLPPFPPPHIMLHSEDSSNRVFIAVGRALMSVNNCAMTIKDLADLSMKFGLACQNPSAAGQAITTYIRNHLQRCEAQQDHPLLLRHIMSGTLSDDELVSALHSRVGGAHCNEAENRVTNFRRGTFVWYLSKAAGAPCPFARAGISLSEYGENGKIGAVVNPGRERKRERDRLRRAEQCGQKRKRLFRACADNIDSQSDSSDEESRPPKVKLTLRLKPSRASAYGSTRLSSPSPSPSPEPEEVIDLSNDDSDAESMSVDSSESEEELESVEEAWPLPPCSQRSNSIPTYSSSPEVAYPPAPPTSDSSRRSFSIPFSATSGSPPPDSEDEDDDFHISMTGVRRASTSRSRYISDELPEDDDELDSGFFSGRELDVETHWEESPGPRSPSAQFEDDAVVKHEPRDVQGLLDAWDDFDLAVTDRKVVDVVAQAAAGLDGNLPQPKGSDSDMWNWQGFMDSTEQDLSYTTDHRLSVHPKQEELDSAFTFDIPHSFDPLPVSEFPLSPFSAYSAPTSPRDFVPEESPESHRVDRAVWGDTVQPHDLDVQEWDDIPRRSVGTKTAEAVASVAQGAAVASSSSYEPSCSPPDTSQSSFEMPLDIPDQHPDATASSSSLTPPELPCDLLTETVSYFPQLSESADSTDLNSVLVVHPCQPCVPAICATDLEGIPVYQMTLGSSLLLRRVDSDYVNISPIQEFLGLVLSTSALPNAVVVSQGSSVVCGMWVPAEAARLLIHDQPLVSVFLSENLKERFPSDVEDLRKPSPHGHHFGRHFGSTVEAKRESFSSYKLELPSRDPAVQWEAGQDSPWDDVEDHLLSVHPPFALGSAVRVAPVSLSGSSAEPEIPLSPTEEEMFHTLCSVTDWDATECELTVEQLPARAAAEVADSKPSKERVGDPPLRRSKRVLATAVTTIATRSRTRSNKRGSRSSLS